MEVWYYEVVEIDGDYANLKRTDSEVEDLKLVARALLPEGIRSEPVLNMKCCNMTSFRHQI